MTLVDADYLSLATDVVRSDSVGVIAANLALAKAQYDGSLNVPLTAELPGATDLGKVSGVVVADEALPIKTYLLRHYPG